MSANPGPVGDCYPTAWRVANELVDQAKGPVTVLIVHGRPLCQPDHPNRALRGQRVGHAWVEQRFEMDGVEFWMVHDLSQGNRIITNLGRWYQQWDLDDDLVKRYTIDEAAALMLDEFHYGPWGEGVTASTAGEVDHEV